MAKIWKCQKRAKMSITYPKVCQSIHGKYYIDFILNNRRYRLKNGNKIKLKLNPNSFPIKHRRRQAELLAKKVYDPCHIKQLLLWWR